MSGLEVLASNPLVGGVVAMGLTGAALFALREVPAKLGVALKEAATVSLHVDSDDPAYAHLSVWLSRQATTRHARRLMLAEAYDYESGEWRWDITLGGGWHLLRVFGRLVLVHRSVQAPDALAKALGGGKRERLTLTTFGGDQGVLRRLIPEARRIYMGGDLVEVLFWAGGGYQIADKRRPRRLDTVFLPAGQLARVTGDLQRFLASREAYRARGVPWRRGYLFEGPPGTGKTTLIQALAGLVGRGIYVISLGNLSGDNELFSAVNAVAQDGVLVLEDIDAVRVSHERSAPSAPSPAAIAPPGAVMLASGQVGAAEEKRGVTLTGLLNAIDGVTAREGRVLFMTSNRPDVLDAALVRPGRVDVRERIDLLGEDEARAMHGAFFPGARPEAFDALDLALPISAAALQNRLLALMEAGA